MTRHHKPSSWQSSNWRFDINIQEEVKKCYPPAVMKKIIKAACLEKIEPDPDKQAELDSVVTRY